MKKSRYLSAKSIALVSILLASCSITKNSIHKSINGSIDLSTASRSDAPSVKTGQAIGFNAAFSLTEDIPKHKPDSGHITGPIDNNFFSISGGLELAEKGYMDEGSGLKSVVNFYYMGIPVTINYNLKTNSGNMLRIGLGAYIAEALYGHYSTTYTDGSGYSGTLEFNDSGGYRSLDIGLRAVAGYSLSKKVELYLSYDFGLYNAMQNYKAFNTHDYQRNRSISINVAYRFK